MIHNSCLSAHTQKYVNWIKDFSYDMTYVREVTKLTIILLAYIDYFYVKYALASLSWWKCWVDLEPMWPGFESRDSHDFFYYYYLFFFYVFFFFWSLLLQCKFANSTLLSLLSFPTLLLLMMPRPPAPSALWFTLGPLFKQTTIRTIGP